MSVRRGRMVAAIAAAVAAAAAAAVLAGCSQGLATGGHTAAVPTGSGHGGNGHTAAAGQGTSPVQGAPASFHWFTAAAAPGSWARVSVPGQPAVLSYPHALHAMRSDPGAVSAGLTSATGTVLVYLNVTPRQGHETLRDWPVFRVSHLREEGQRAVHIDATSGRLMFRGGRGRCVIDDYTTKIDANHYREIACFVRAAHGGSVLVAATPDGKWRAYAGLLEQAVSSYRAG
jgi:hypothetical protein